MPELKTIIFTLTSFTLISWVIILSLNINNTSDLSMLLQLLSICLIGLLTKLLVHNESKRA